MSTGKIIVGAIAGVAVGALLGVLFAPDKGSETRKKIAKKSSDTVNDLKKKFENLMDDVSEKFEDGKEDVRKTYGGKAKTKVEGFSKDGQTA